MNFILYCMIRPVTTVKEKEKNTGTMPKKKEPTYVEDSARDPEDAWIFDSLVGFLRGPVWHVPVMSFIEQKSLSKYLTWKIHNFANIKADSLEELAYVNNVLKIFKVVINI